MSDGFGLTQLEAQAWKLPVVASRFCGDVVRDGVNGLLLDEVSGRSIATALRSLLSQPRRLAEMSRSATSGEYGLGCLRTELLRLTQHGNGPVHGTR